MDDTIPQVQKSICPPSPERASSPKSISSAACGVAALPYPRMFDRQDRATLNLRMVEFGCLRTPNNTQSANDHEFPSGIDIKSISSDPKDDVISKFQYLRESVVRLLRAHKNLGQERTTALFPKRWVYGFEYERQIYAVKIRVRTTELDWSMWDTELSSEGEVLRRLCNSGHRNLPIGYQLSDIDAKGLDIWDTEGVALTITVRINAEGA
ncbi:hypothetical protein B0H13DRAFT_2295924, partial [Mycena leptocephala]